MECLSKESKKISTGHLNKTWFKGADNRYQVETLQKFILYNKRQFDFLKLIPIIGGNGKNTTVSFRSDKFIGAIPLKSPITGKQIGDFIVTPRFNKLGGSEYNELIEISGMTVQPEFIAPPSLPLSGGAKVKPPAYAEAMKFMNLLSKAVKYNWRKFQEIKSYKQYPKGVVDWNEYARKSFDPKDKLRFPSYISILSKLHEEFFEIKFVYNIAKAEIESSRTPETIKVQIRETLTYLDSVLSNLKSLEVSGLNIHANDPPIIKSLKIQANKILKQDITEVPAWRIDFEQFFEKYIQYIFGLVSIEIGAKPINNYKVRLNSLSLKPEWSLRYLEPDAVAIKDKLALVVDAKYKSHLFNLNESTQYLKDEHRKDLHQILAYLSFFCNRNKIGFLCYPSLEFQAIPLQYEAQISDTKNNLILIGIPMARARVSEFKKSIIELIVKLVNT
jgi:hypothetical protein